MENKNKNKVSENVYSMIPLMLKYKIKEEKLKKLRMIISGEENVVEEGVERGVTLVKILVLLNSNK